MVRHDSTASFARISLSFALAGRDGERNAHVGKKDVMSAHGLSNGCFLAV